MPEQIEIRPAILAYSHNQLVNELEALLPVTRSFDIDVIDWQHAKATIEATQALNHDLQVDLCFDLMQNYPMSTVELLVTDPRVSRIIINLHENQDLLDLLMLIKKEGRQAGISIDPGDDPAQYLPHLAHVDLVQIMTVVPGQQGGLFLPKQLELINVVRQVGFTGIIGVDGGVNDKTIEQIRPYKPNYVSVGSYLSKAIDPIERFKTL